jgi:membrane dipeptidase
MRLELSAAQEERARRLHAESLVLDAHVVTMLAVAGGSRSLGQRSDQGHCDLPRFREGGVNAAFFSLFTGGPRQPTPLRRFMQLVDLFYAECEQNRDQMVFARSAGEIEAAWRAGKFAAVMKMDGGEPIHDDLAILRNAYRLGVRVMLPCWGGRNRIGDGVFSEDQRPTRMDGNLTDFGVQVIEECNRLGILIDVSHMHPRCVADVLEISRQPVIASHCNAMAVFRHVRNLTDDQIRAIARRGGVVCATFTFLTDDREHATLEMVLDHIDHLLRVAGAGHVGIGSDYDGIGGPAPRGLEDAACFWNLTRGLVARGHSDEIIRNVLGANVLRLFREVVG